MLSVEIEQLTHLAGGVNESLGEWLASRKLRNAELAPGVAFSDLEKEFARTEIEAENKGFPNASRLFSRTTLKSLCPPIEYVGVGSSREAYACFGGRCLKLAIKKAGCAQNKAEMEVAGPRILKKRYDCFSQVYTISDGGWLLLTECCSPADDREKLAHELGVSSWTTIVAMMRAIQRQGPDFTAKDALGLMAKYSDPDQGESTDAWSRRIQAAADEAFAVSKAAQAKKPGEKQEMLAQLFDFWKKNGVQKLLPFDLTDPGNWGYAIRNDEIRPVVIDAGFSGEVAKEYYM